MPEASTGPNPAAMPSDVQRFHAAALQVTEWGTQRDACACSVVASTVSARAWELERHVTETCVPVATLGQPEAVTWGGEAAARRAQ